MDLTKYTNKSPKTVDKKETIIDNKEVTITKIGDEIEFILKTKDALDKYQDFLFFSQTNSLITDNDEEAQKFFTDSIERGTEGLMFKSLKSSYKPGIRTGAMAKLKEAKEDIDVVILAAEHGRGKRAGYLSSFYVGVKNNDYTDDSDKFLEIGKVSSGIKELGEGGHSMDNLTRLLKPLKIGEDKGIVSFEPKIVIQVRYQEIQQSTAYSSGYALRFPRIIALREDKDIEEINSIDDIENFI